MGNVTHPHACLPLLAIALSLIGGGCSFQLGTALGTDSKAREPSRMEAAAFVDGSPARVDAVPESDGALRAAARELLTRNEPDASMPWEDPRTGARGTVTPITNAYTQAGLTCRDFLASYIRSNRESWLQGEACRAEQGQWEVRSLKPWVRS